MLTPLRPLRAPRRSAEAPRPLPKRDRPLPCKPSHRPLPRPPKARLPKFQPRGPAPARAARGEGKPGSEGRRGGSGKQEGGRSRGPRPRPATAPPPPPSPPEPHQADHLLAQLAYVIVNEAGASVYSTSQVGRDELPEFDATLRSAISIGRRLQDPLAELVKIEPQNIGVGLYQHDVNPKQLKETLESVISSCVNFVGVDLNTASVSLLRHVSGLNQLTARRIVDFRKEKGNFSGRDQLTQVEGIGPATFTQAAGFLKIPEGAHPFDRTWVHPESYEVASRLLEKVGLHSGGRPRQGAACRNLQAKLAEANVRRAGQGAGGWRVHPSRHHRGPQPARNATRATTCPSRSSRRASCKLEDLAPAMELKGTVLNVVDFGAFVDIGLKDSGLVHISQLANRYIKSPHDVVSVGDVVTVWVMSVDQERKRVSLTMVKPGTERQRGGPQGGPRRGRRATNHRGKARARAGEIAAAALVPVARRSRRHRSALRRSPHSTEPPGAVLTEIAIVNEAARPARRPARSGLREAIGLPPPGGFPHAPSGPRHGPGPARGGPRSGQGPFGPGSGPGRPGPFRPERSGPTRAGSAFPTKPAPAAPLQRGPHGKRSPAHVWPAQTALGSTRGFARGRHSPVNLPSRSLSRQPTTSRHPRQIRQTRPHLPRKPRRETLARLKLQ